ncbi:hypothetical protein MINTM001_24700 [Mycobacterium paraintracellulare]|uniref:hypothetical protein n=1 Tax=Mycobacterium paraintracellulare TaxID=1138383 RepID=UPI001925A6EE|nr:hypothetical protein [Mycobacterium paraintracellulare]BCO41331.1 hypothetical protein MINTM001_24700 [Mycobacterium paraintracellulare]
MGEQVTFIKTGSVSDTMYPVEAIAVVPGTSSENVRRDVIALGVVMSVLLPPAADWLPAGVTMTERDYMAVRGKEYQVEGRPIEWVSPFGGPGGFEVLLKPATG